MRSFSSLGVFCGSAKGNQDIYAQDAQYLGQTLAKRHIRLVYGAGGDGLMGCVANACLKAGGDVLGLQDVGLAPFETQKGVGQIRSFPDLAARKQALFDESDAFCVLPGGIGTLDELSEVIALRQIHRLDKPIVLYNRSGFWQPFADMVRSLHETGFVRQNDLNLFTMADSIDDVLNTIEKELKK